MILYHGSFLEVQTPDLLHTRHNVDFGAGFYTTPIYNQAVKWCSRFKRRGKTAVISRYIFNEAPLGQLKVLNFETYSESWLDFVLSCRREKDISDYDVVIGGVANDQVFNTVELYFDGLIDKTEALNRLRYEKPNLQICFRTQEAIDTCLHFEGSEQI